MGQPLFLCLIHGPWDVGLRRGQYDRVNDTNGRKCQQMYRRDPQANLDSFVKTPRQAGARQG